MNQSSPGFRAFFLILTITKLLFTMGFKKFFWIGMTVIPLFLLNSCIQEEKLSPIQIENQVDAIVEKIHSGFFDFEVKGGTEDQRISIENEGMDGVYGVRMSDLENLEGENLSLFICSNSLNPGILQKIKINDASNTFAVCRYSVGLSYKAEVAVLLEQIEDERLEIIGRFDQGNITASELDAEMKRLRESFSVSYLAIKNFYSEFFKECLHTLVTEISKIFNEDQWQTFVKCVDI